MGGKCQYSTREDNYCESHGGAVACAESNHEHCKGYDKKKATNTVLTVQNITHGVSIPKV
jgi:hypothetical protein